MIVSKRTQGDTEQLNAAGIAKFMKKHGISEKEFSEIFGVTPQAVTLWLSGKRHFSVTNSRLLLLLDKYPTLIREF